MLVRIIDGMQCKAKEVEKMRETRHKNTVLQSTVFLQRESSRSGYAIV